MRGSVRVPFIIVDTLLSYQLKLIKMRAKLANLNPCAVPLLSSATANLYIPKYSSQQK